MLKLQPHGGSVLQRLRTRAATALLARRGMASKPYDKLTLGVPKETVAGEKRVAQVPETVAKFHKAGFSVVVQSGAGEEANFSDAAYEEAGASVVKSAADVFGQSDIIVKVRPPAEKEVAMLNSDKTLVSLLYPGVNTELVDKIKATGATSFALDAIPRISRAQAFDVLSSMSNISGYKAVIEAANHFGRFFTGQVRRKW